MLQEEDTPGPISAVETKTLDPNSIAASSSAISVIENTTVVYEDINATNPILTTKPISDSESDDEHEYSDDDKDYDYDDDEVE